MYLQYRGIIRISVSVKLPEAGLEYPGSTTLKDSESVEN